MERPLTALSKVHGYQGRMRMLAAQAIRPIWQKNRQDRASWSVPMSYVISGALTIDLRAAGGAAIWRLKTKLVARPH
eukprot:3120225-Prymnesium_polylepis.1